MAGSANWVYDPMVDYGELYVGEELFSLPSINQKGVFAGQKSEISLRAMIPDRNTKGSKCPPEGADRRLRKRLYARTIRRPVTLEAVDRKK